MFMSEEEFRKMMSAHPTLKIRGQQAAFKNQPKKPELKRAKKEKEEEDGAGPFVRKYRNVKVYVFEDGYVSEDVSETGHGKIKEVYDSRKEYARYLQLCEMEKAGKISQLERQKTLIIQPAFVYQGKKIRAMTYNADFEYVENGVQVVEDVKGWSKLTKKYRTTEAFNLKWKLLKARYPDFDFRLF